MATNAPVLVEDVNPIGGGHATITVKVVPGLVAGNGHIGAKTGNVEATIQLVGHAAQGYSFNIPAAGGGLGNHPVCVYKVNSGVTSCGPGTFPNTGGWGYSNAGKTHVTLNIPPFPAGEHYEYVLFLTEKQTDNQVTVDPLIGCCVSSYKPDWFSGLVKSAPELTLVLLCSAFFALGIFPGHKLWTLSVNYFRGIKGNKKPPLSKP